MCEGFASQGAETTLIHPQYLNNGGSTTWDELAEYYGIEKRFDVISVPSLLHESGIVPKVGGASMLLSLTGAILWRYLRGELDGEDVIYSRNQWVSYTLATIFSQLPNATTPGICFEIHCSPDRFDAEFFEGADGFVFITQTLEDMFVDAYGLSRNRCLVAHDGVRLASYEGPVPDRSSLDLPDGPVVMYTGHLYEGQSGVETLVQAAGDIDAAVYIVGGYDADIDRLQSAYDVPENVTFTGFVEPAEIRRYQRAADILVAPYHEESREYMSPLKIFEYMAAGAPVVASRLPVLGEVLEDESNCLLFEPNDPDELAASVTRLLGDTELRERLTARAREDVTAYDWQVRAKRIEEFIQRL
jgi:glycosyltransferase involved in cell wall biosynthesis